tara:strand:+ start:2009 stop:3085 length:1077 start_codon:yes stop_codon:yes gene_type:complete
VALINCYECSKEISDKAIICPNCGAPQSEKKQKESNSNEIPLESKTLTPPKLSKLISKFSNYFRKNKPKVSDSDKEPITLKILTSINSPVLRSLLNNYLLGIKKTILYALGLAIIFVALLLYFNRAELVDFNEAILYIIVGPIVLLMYYIGLYTVYYLFKIKAFSMIFTYLKSKSVMSQIDNKKEFTDLKTNGFENLVFFLLLWSILHLILIFAGCFEGYAYYSSYYDEFSPPAYDNPRMFGESMVYIILVFLPYWIIKLLTSIVISIKKKSFEWPNNIMLKFLPIATAFIFCIIYIPILQDSAQKTKERIRMMSKQSEQEFKKRADDMLKENIKNNPVFQENIDRLLEENKFELQEK